MLLKLKLLIPATRNLEKPGNGKGKETKKAISAIVIALLLTSMLLLSLNIRLARAPATIIVPDDYSTIQAAINAASDGDTIFVRNGTYYENLIVNKSVSLVGENKTSTIIDGSKTGGDTVTVTDVDNASISGFTIQGGRHGIYVYPIWSAWCNGTTITDNVVRNNTGNGIYLLSSSHSTILGNTVAFNGGAGILISSHSPENTLKNNNLTMNYRNFEMGFQSHPMTLDDFMQDIDTSNKVDGRTLYYWVNQADREVPSDAGYVAIVNSTNISVQNLNLTRNGQGVLFAYTTDSTIENIVAAENDQGIFLWASKNNTIRNNVLNDGAVGIYIDNSSSNVVADNLASNNLGGIEELDTSSYNNLRLNTLPLNYFGILIAAECDFNLISTNNVTNNTVGIELEGNCDNNTIECNTVSYSRSYGIILSTYPTNNTLYHNNFINNANQVSTDGSPNVWDDGYPSGGNYWSDYNGTDLFSGPYQNETGSDGIGDTPYVIDSNNTDHYPLMQPWTGLLHDVAVTNVTANRTWVYQGFSANINVTVFNKGNFSENVAVALYCNVTANEIVGTQNITIPAGESEILTFVWDTKGIPYNQNYTLTAAARIPIDNYPADNTLAGGPVTVRILGDINGDGRVDGRDITIAARAFGTRPGYPRWNPDADINGDGMVDGRDITLIARNFGK
jgi:parallel beta-helix repeat protein